MCAQVGQLPCLEISSTVTAYGREGIEATKNYVETEYTVAKGYDHDAQVIYGDTDSVMIKFGPADLATCMAMGLEAASKITDALFKKPMKLEFEKCYFPYLLLNKKRYAGWKHEDGSSKAKFDTKGLENERRDNCLFVREAVDATLREICNRDLRPPEFAALRTAVQQLYENKVGLSKLIRTAQLTKPPDEYTASIPGHVLLAKRMRDRDPGSAPPVGSRVPTVIVQTNTKSVAGYKKITKGEQTEHPLYVLKHGLVPDPDHYIARLREPAKRILEYVDSDKEKEIFGPATADKRVKTISSASPLAAFFSSSAGGGRCVACHAVLPKGCKSLCLGCRPRELEIYTDLMGRADAAQRQSAALAANCASCQVRNRHPHVTVLNAVDCANVDCPVFYTRHEKRRECAKLQAQLEGFSLDW